MVVVITVPYMLNLRPVRNQIAGKLSSAINGRFEVKKISWSWLPSPRLTVKDAMVLNAMVDATIAEASVRLNLSTLLPGNWKDGHVELTAKDGTLKKLSSLSKIFTLINVTELFSVDKIRLFFSKGYPYSKLKLSGEISDNRLNIKEAFLIGDGLDFFVKGSVRPDDKMLDLIVYTKPFKTIDSIVTILPFVGKDFGGGEESIALIPIKVKGKIGDPVVSFYKGKYLESDKRYLRDLLKKTISLPFRMLDAIKPDESLHN